MVKQILQLERAVVGYGRAYELDSEFLEHLHREATSGDEQPELPCDN